MAKINVIRRRFINGKVHQVETAKALKICRSTLQKYIAEFKDIREHYPEKLNDMNFFMPVVRPGHRPTVLYQNLMKVLPGLIERERAPKLRPLPIWRKYRLLYPDGYAFSPFKDLFYAYCKEQDICLFSSNRIDHISEEDQHILKKWRGGNDHRNWQIAVVLEAAATRKQLLKITDKIDASFPTVLTWIKKYNKTGLADLHRKKHYQPCKYIEQAMNERMGNVVKLLHESPKLHGIYKTSWTIWDLFQTYNKIYPPVCYSTISKYIRKQGLYLRKAKEVLTSPDPKFREKLSHIQDILSHLGKNEKFFSIDEFGPRVVKIRGGRALAWRGQRRVYPQKQKGKGLIIFTAALELSTNQITHFYTLKNDTEETIRLVDLLLIQYRDADKLYLSWDAISWHNSKRLNERIKEINNPLYRSTHGTPSVELAPLPSSAQFLNVIESVFAGLAKTVLHNSDYPSLEHCKEAIDAYFQKRNAYFLKNPQKAGNKIWGKERVKPVFSDAHHCKNPFHR